MPSKSLEGKVILVIGSGTPDQRGVVVALAEAGADVAVGGPAGLAYEVLLNSIANEVWAIGRRAVVTGFDASDAGQFAAAVERVRGELGRVDLVVRCEAVLSA